MVQIQMRVVVLFLVFSFGDAGLSIVNSIVNNNNDILLDGARGVAVSPDGANVYAVSYSNAIVTFSRNPSNGQLSIVNSIVDNGDDILLYGAYGVAVSPDGSSVYVVSYLSSAIVTFSRNLSNGQLSIVNSIVDNGNNILLGGAVGVVVSPDGASVYVASSVSDAIVTFSRNLSNGQLSIVNSIVDNGNNILLNGAYGVAVSPDGASVYVVSYISSAIVTFSRNPSNGQLSIVNSIVDNGNNILLNGAGGVVVSPDGSSVYVVSYLSSAIVTFSRNPSNGKLYIVNSIVHNGDDILLDGAVGVVVSPDGSSVYVVSYLSSAIAPFSRNFSNGQLSIVNSIVDNGKDILLGGAYDVAVSPDGFSVYVASFFSDAITIFNSLNVPTDSATDNIVIISIVSTVSILVLAIVLFVLWRIGLLKKFKKNSTDATGNKSYSMSISTVNSPDLQNDVSIVRNYHPPTQNDATNNQRYSMIMHTVNSPPRSKGVSHPPPRPIGVASVKNPSPRRSPPRPQRPNRV